jgi:hypothetical protein
MACPHVATCPLFPLFTLKASLSVWQIHYCNGQFETCERHRLGKNGTRVPPNLLPNGRTLEFAVR